MTTGSFTPIWGMCAPNHHAILNCGDLEHRPFFNLSADEAVALKAGGDLGIPARDVFGLARVGAVSDP